MNVVVAVLIACVLLVGALITATAGYVILRATLCRRKREWEHTNHLVPK